MVEKNLQKLVTQAQEHEDWMIRVGAIAQLATIDSVEATEAIIQACEDEHWHVRLSAVMALKDITRAGVVDQLTKMTADEMPDIRAVAYTNLNVRPAHASLTVLTQGINDSDATVCLASLNCVQSTQVAKLEKVLFKKLEDDDSTIRKSALEKLTRFHDQLSKKEDKAEPNSVLGPGMGLRMVLEKLLPLKDHEDWRVRRAFIEVLSYNLHDGDNLHILISCLDDKSVVVKDFALYHLVKSNLAPEKVLFNFLEKYQHYTLRRTVINGLADYQGKLKQSVVIELTKDSDLVLRVKAKEILKKWQKK